MFKVITCSHPHYLFKRMCLVKGLIGPFEDRLYLNKDNVIKDEDLYER